MEIKKVAFQVWSLKIDDIYIEQSTKKKCMDVLELYTRLSNDKRINKNNLSRILSKHVLRLETSGVK